MKPTKTWILIANSKEAFLLENTGPGHGLRKLEGKTWSWQPGPDYSDQPGRSFDSHGQGRHKMEPHQGGDDEVDFSKKLMGDLAGEYRKESFDRLILCAPPSMLGKLRKELPDELAQVIAAELDKDLVPIPKADLPTHFETVLAV